VTTGEFTKFTSASFSGRVSSIKPKSSEENNFSLIMKETNFYEKI